MAKIPNENGFRSNKFKDDIFITSFSSIPGIVVPILSTLRSGTLFFVGNEEECSQGKGMLSLYDIDLFVNSCIMYKKYFGERLTSVYFSYLDDEKTNLHVIFYLD